MSQTCATGRGKLCEKGCVYFLDTTTSTSCQPERCTDLLIIMRFSYISLLYFVLLSPLILIVNSQSYNDVICRRPWYFNSPRPAPLRCPTPSFFTYYECCGEFLENCCWRFRQEPIIISVILLVLLFLLCCCCCIAWLAFGRKKKSTRVEPEKQLTTTKKDSQIQTISSSTIDSGTQWELRKGYEETERRRSYATARDRELDYQYFS